MVIFPVEKSELFETCNKHWTVNFPVAKSKLFDMRLLTLRTWIFHQHLLMLPKLSFNSFSVNIPWGIAGTRLGGKVQGKLETIIL